MNARCLTTPGPRCCSRWPSPPPLRAAVYVPTTTADTTHGACAADCSLRDAIAAANQHPGEDVILLHAGTYILGGTPPATGNLEIDGDLILIGDGAGRTIIDGGGVGGIFYVPAGATVDDPGRDAAQRPVAGGGRGDPQQRQPHPPAHRPHRQLQRRGRRPAPASAAPSSPTASIRRSP